MTVETEARNHEELKKFLAFLQNVGRRYPVRVNYRARRRGRFRLEIDATPSSQYDALLQELILNRALYYYACSIRSSSEARIVNSVVASAVRQLLESRFNFTQIKFVRRHIRGTIPPTVGVPGDMENPIAHEYEIMFRRWDLGILSDWDFVKDTDSLLTRFLLWAVEHNVGDKSPRFGKLLNSANRRGLAMVRETRKDFEEIHTARTSGLHRLSNSLVGKKLNELGLRLYLYFEYFDEFHASQQTKVVRIYGNRYRRIKYGSEIGIWEEAAAELSPCHDCNAIVGQYHCDGCDWEQCPRCLGQRLGCPSCQEDE